MGSEKSERASFAEVLRNRNFLALWLGQAISQIGDSFTFLALLIMVNQLTGSTISMGMMMISLTLPQLVFSFLAGVIVDRLDRKKIMIFSDLLRGLLVLAFLTVRSAEQVYILYIVGFLVSTVSVFFWPARTAMIPRIVEGEAKLLSANALSQTTRVAAMLIGPALAGFLIAWLGASLAFVVDSLTYLVSAIAVLTMTTGGETLDQERLGTRMVWQRFTEGFSYMLRHSTVLGIIVTVMVGLLGIGAVEVLFVPFLQGEFGLGPEGLGFVQTTQGVGMLLGSVLIGNLAARFRLTRIIAWSLALLGIAVAACGLVHQFVFILIAVFVAGLGLPPLNAALTTLMQITVPDEKLGRVGSVVDTCTTLSYLISMGGAAFLADAFGMRTVLVGAGITTALSIFPALTMMKEPESPASGGLRAEVLATSEQAVEA
jgi:DHA3 family macrolide efflux protein-like MFS transporter